MTKLTAAQKDEIRTKRASGEKALVLAVEYGVTINWIFVLCRKDGMRKANP